MSIKKLPLTLSLALFSCQTLPQSKPSSPLSTLPLSQHVLGEEITHVSDTSSMTSVLPGQWQYTGEQLTLTLRRPGDFSTQLLDLSSATGVVATLTDSQGNIYRPLGADANGAIAYTGGVLTLRFEQLKPDTLYLVELHTLSGASMVPHSQLSTVLKPSNGQASGSINFQTSVAAQVIKSLLASNPTRARNIDLAALERLAADITGVSGTAPNFTYASLHPGLVNITALAEALLSRAPDTLQAADYRQQGVTLNLTVTGLLDNDKVRLQVTDPASAVLSDLGNGVHHLSGIKPGGPYDIKVSPSGTPTGSYRFTLNSSTLSASNGQSVNATLTAVPLAVANFTPVAGAAGTQVTLNGSNFSGITAITIGGANANFTVNSDTQITVTVPSTAVDGAIVVTQGVKTVQSVDNFDVYRRIHVKSDATGAGNGTTWTDAYPSLQDALTASGAQDEIWVASGVYKPTGPGGNQGTSFNLKSNVTLYGGFTGNETTLAARDFQNHLTVLSGDLNGDDDFTTIPATQISDNSRRVLNIQANATLDGVTIQSANSTYNGGGANAIGSGVTIRNTVFNQNHAANSGGGLYVDASNVTLNKVVFKRCSARGGAGLFVNMSQLQADQLVFDTNLVQTDNGLAGVMRVEALAADSSVSNVVFVNNSFNNFLFIANVYHPSNNLVRLTMDNALVVNNSSPNMTEMQWILGGGSGSFVGNNFTLANNACPTHASGNCDLDRSGFAAVTYNNYLFWKTGYNVVRGGADTVDLGETGAPFVNPADPDGPDNLWFTADDGFNYANGTINGVDDGISGPDIPDTDIVGRARAGAGTDAGAYEFIP